MKNTETVFIKILKAYINGCDIDLTNFTDWSGLLKLAQIHNVSGIVADIIKKENLSISKEYSEIIDKNLFCTVSSSVMWDNIYIEVTSALAKNKIKNIVVKGPVIKKYYPDPDLRTMGDIDLIINKNDISRAAKIMESLGFTYKYTDIDEYHFTRNNICVELHEDLISKDMGTGVDYKREMQRLFDNVKDHNEYAQELTDEYHLIYLILHTARHFLGSGCGVRQIMDISVLVKNTDIDFKFLWEKLNKLKLTDFAHNIFYLCKKWFDVMCDEYEADDELYNMVSEYIIYGGVFGKAVEREKEIITTNIIHNGRIATFFSYAFPNVYNMKTRLEWFQNKSSLLLPIAWIYRWYIMCKKNPNKIKKYIKTIFYKDYKNSSRYVMLKAMGFYKK